MGFRNSVECLKERGFKVQLPTYLKKEQKQDTTKKRIYHDFFPKNKWDEKKSESADKEVKAI